MRIGHSLSHHTLQGGWPRGGLASKRIGREEAGLEEACLEARREDVCLATIRIVDIFASPNQILSELVI